MKTCSIDGCKNKVWSKNLCLIHTPKKPLKSKKKAIKKYSEKGLAKKESKKEYTLKQFALFQKIYNEHPTKLCFECGIKVLPGSSVNYHHCLYKSQYPQYALDKKNIVLVCYSCHEKTHISIDKTPKIKEYTQKLKLKYG